MTVESAHRIDEVRCFQARYGEALGPSGIRRPCLSPPRHPSTQVTSPDSIWVRPRRALGANRSRSPQGCESSDAPDQTPLRAVGGRRGNGSGKAMTIEKGRRNERRGRDNQPPSRCDAERLSRSAWRGWVPTHSGTRRSCASTEASRSSCDYGSRNSTTAATASTFTTRPPARDAGIPRAKIDTLTAWWETDLHSEAERAALRYAEALTRAADTDADRTFQRFHEGLAKHFDAAKILEIIGVVVNMNVWTRLKLAEGAKPAPRSASAQALGIDVTYVAIGRCIGICAPQVTSHRPSYGHE